MRRKRDSSSENALKQEGQGDEAVIASSVQHCLC